MQFGTWIKTNNIYTYIDSEGETLEKEEVFGSVEAVKTVSDLFMPLSGEIVEVCKTKRHLSSRISRRK